MISKKHTGVIAVAAAAAAALMSGGVMASDLATAGGNQAASQSGDMASRVKQALHADPTLLDKHINVSMKDGKVVMSGFVASAGDLHKAVRMADDTAGEKNVVNQLTIKEGGDGGAG